MDGDNKFIYMCKIASLTIASNTIEQFATSHGACQFAYSTNARCLCVCVCVCVYVFDWSGNQVNSILIWFSFVSVNVVRLICLDKVSHLAMNNKTNH